MINKTCYGLLLLGLSVYADQSPAKDLKPDSRIEAANVSGLQDEKAKISYGLGLDMGKNYKHLGLEVDVATLIQGLQDGYRGQPQKIPSDELGMIMTRFQQGLKEIQAKGLKKWGEVNQREETAFLAENAKKEGVVTLPSGLQYKILEKGNGPIPTDEDWVSCVYRGKLLDGTEFDSSYRAGKPAVFKVDGATPGWREALKLMPQGSKWQLFVPSALGYGERGAGRDIGPNAMLIFEVELLSANAGVGVPAAAAK